MKTWDQFSITSNSGMVCPPDKSTCTDAEKMPKNAVSDLFVDLGLTVGGKELFSINVAPPLGAGTLDAAGTFKQASDVCFSGIRLSSTERTKLAGANLGELQTSIDRMRACAASFSRTQLEQYYLSGIWYELCDDEYVYNEASKKCENPGDPSDTMDANDPKTAGSYNPVLTDFHSASKSCESFELALMSSRSQEFGKFDTALKNYIEENIARLIQKKTRDMAKISQAFMSVKELNDSMQQSLLQMKINAHKMQTQIMLDIMQAELDLDEMRMNMTRQEINHRRERAKMFSEAYRNQIRAVCMPKIYAVLIAAWQGQNGGVFDIKANTIMITNDGSMGQNIVAGIANQSVFINQKGDIRTSSPVKRGLTSSPNAMKYTPTIDGATANTSLPEGAQTEILNRPEGMDEYERIFCADMPDYETSIIAPVRADVGMVYDYFFSQQCEGYEPAGTGGVRYCEGGGGCGSGGDNSDKSACSSALSNDAKGSGTESDKSERWNKDKNYIGQDGKCYIRTTKQTSQTASLDSKPAVELEGEHIGRGYELFDTHLLPFLQLGN
jgi:hypothetical protein